MEATGLKLTDLSDGILACMAADESRKGNAVNKPFAELSARYRKKAMDFVKRFAVRILDDDAEDIVQESMIKAYRNIEKYDDTYAFSTWLLRICQNTAIDYIRKKKLLETESIDERGTGNGGMTSSPEDGLISSEGENLILKMIDNLPKKYAEPARLRYIDDLSYRQIAGKLSVSIETVKIRLYRARRKLATMI
ncbi:MAG: sigma-70 family RNA polymerase sigma factor [Bacteroidales bacterium]|jgi:RNA polymerase sigma-70 factor (ECF subfamily)|nr:sigma-70 family RNA polymerase sigma factor [Bacteroidales bacterium]MCI2121600.1 sigma-70 family RNA polymerase sigma factor [Bacteroidales bacterium]MCI2145682.1 sigma-70 family RNA polymerase sigma factor [Bacteroidales bacterium]